MADGPHGLRKVIDDESVHEKAEISVCYPSLVTLASSFDAKLAYKMGNSIAKEFKSKGVNQILGPGINIKRHPYCGRNFEYFSEDPLVTTKMAEGFIKGAKKEDIGVCLKHYALNSQETHRRTSNSLADERAKYEIYYKAFSELVKLEPEMVMSSYNKIDDEYSSDNFHHLKEVLRDEFGFKGVIVSDWAALDDRSKSLIATLDLEMPGCHYNVNKLVRDYKKGIIKIEDINSSVKRILELVEKFNDQKIVPADLDKHHSIASEIAEGGMVLLKNDDNLLPLKETDRVLLIGNMAKDVRFQGGGSSNINAYKIDTIYDTLMKHENVDYVQGYCKGCNNIDQELLEQIKNLAPNYDKVLIVAGLTNEFESEGFDREHLNIPSNQEFIINQVAKLNENIILALQLGSPITMPFIHNIKTVLNCYLGGEAIGTAFERIVFGKVNPSGRLAETFPLASHDIPSDNFFATGNYNTFYQESIYVGYRYFCSVSKDVLFPFGHGLSYSHFEYSGLSIDKDTVKTEKQNINLSINITNNGPFDGDEVVLLFFEAKNPKTPRPKRELIDFNKVFIKNGETQTVKFKINLDSFKYYNSQIKDFLTDDGVYSLQICKSAKEILMEKQINVSQDKEYQASIWNQLNSYNPLFGLTFEDNDFKKLIGRDISNFNISHQRPFTLNNTIGDIENTFIGKKFAKYAEKRALADTENTSDEFKMMVVKEIKAIPLRAIAQLSNDQVKMNQMKAVIALINRHFIKAIFYLLRKD
jgi:beta-glucosidase